MAFNNPYVEWEDIDNPPTEFPTTWGDIADKPTSYPATWGNLADIPEWWPNSLEWSSLTNIPNVWPNGLKPNSITETEISDDSITSPKIAAYAITAGKLSVDALDFWVAKGMRLISGLIETDEDANKGLKIDSSGLRLYNTASQLVASFLVGADNYANLFVKYLKLGPSTAITDSGTSLKIDRDQGSLYSRVELADEKTQIEYYDPVGTGRVTVASNQCTLRSADDVNNVFGQLDAHAKTLQFHVVDGSTLDYLYRVIFQDGVLSVKGWSHNPGLYIWSDVVGKWPFMAMARTLASGLVKVEHTLTSSTAGIAEIAVTAVSGTISRLRLNATASTLSVVGPSGVERALPFAYWTDLITATVAAINTTYSITITYPVGLFTSPPTVQVTARSTNPSQRQMSVTNESATQCTIQYRSTNLSNFPIHFLAIQ